MNDDVIKRLIWHNEELRKLLTAECPCCGDKMRWSHAHYGEKQGWFYHE